MKKGDAKKTYVNLMQKNMFGSKNVYSYLEEPLFFTNT